MANSTYESNKPSSSRVVSEKRTGDSNQNVSSANEIRIKTTDMQFDHGPHWLPLEEIGRRVDIEKQASKPRQLKKLAHTIIGHPKE